MIAIPGIRWALPPSVAHCDGVALLLTGEPRILPVIDPFRLRLPILSIVRIRSIVSLLSVFPPSARSKFFIVWS